MESEALEFRGKFAIDQCVQRLPVEVEIAFKNAARKPSELRFFWLRQKSWRKCDLYLTVTANPLSKEDFWPGRGER